MPELPEVHTTVRGLKKKIVGRTIRAVWTDLAHTTHTTPHLRESLKDKKFFGYFTKHVCGAKVLTVTRRAKNILIGLDTGDTILVHMKMTGHLLFGRYVFDSKKKLWAPDPKETNEALRDPFNKYIHVVFTFNDATHLALSDARKFAKVTLIETSALDKSIHLKDLGPEPLEKTFTFETMVTQLMKRPRTQIKQVLMDQTIIAGVGNIYSDEMLFLACIHPETPVEQIPSKQLRALYVALQKVLTQGIDFGGDSMSDYRNIDGRPGKFQHHHNVYRRTGAHCPKRGCTGIIERKVIGGRSAHFCPTHQH
jgi:formamidopyrimidine-DNA glycosylase